ncbi:MAG: glycine--tRNA ligase subunit beta, partial [Burkholderiales bacterium]|nr:glycine--tRNA ligase subunit beta [Burkholderiales bacterium]
MSIASLLVELFTEELPPKALKKLGDSFAAGINAGLHKRSLLDTSSVVTMFASPRRLAVHITDVKMIAPDEIVVRKLMPVTVGIDADGKATQALAKKLAALGKPDFDVSALEREGEGKAQQLLLREWVKGQSLQAALQSSLEETIAALPVPKVMSYQLSDGVTTVQFVRPVHGLVALHGATVVPIHVLGHDANAVTHGHRFQGAIDIELKHADEYESRLENEGGVIASFEKRRAEIMRLLFAHAEQTGDTLGEPEDYEALLDEV